MLPSIVDSKMYVSYVNEIVKQVMAWSEDMIRFWQTVDCKNKKLWKIDGTKLF